ncbi:DinB family protein [Fulvivirgaceae bacterium BMA10]|uniref:DinB family protein n=1 Tax=Splendidivirga corallicola TaxID=3051826 RepID=A0ABT8KSH8_9BACT|nr:DinB family protein [Fulvivirgaceae bacterium BMA10]
MDLISFFFSRYTELHERIIPMMLSNLTETEIRNMHDKTLNPIAWLVWHMARAEDVGINRMVIDGEQVFDEGDWETKLGVATRNAGTGMTGEEVDSLARSIDLNALEDYRAAVFQQTKNVLNTLSVQSLSEIPSFPYLQKVFCTEGVLPKHTWQLLELYRGKTKGWFLMHLGETHNFYHLGQISMIRKLLKHDKK